MTSAAPLALDAISTDLCEIASDLFTFSRAIGYRDLSPILHREIAAEVGSQVILVTHSEVILDAALDRNLTLLLDAKADSLAAKPDIRDTLKHAVAGLDKSSILQVDLVTKF